LDLNSLLLLSQPFVTFLSNRKLDSFIERKTDQSGAPFSNDEDVVQSSSKGVSNRVLDVHNVERTRMALSMPNDADTTHVVATGDHAKIARVELDVVGDFSCLNVDNHGIVNLNNKKIKLRLESKYIRLIKKDQTKIFDMFRSKLKITKNDVNRNVTFK